MEKAKINYAYDDLSVVDTKKLWAVYRGYKLAIRVAKKKRRIITNATLEARDRIEGELLSRKAFTIR